jgi:hypothetical protein
MHKVKTCTADNWSDLASPTVHAADRCGQFEKIIMKIWTSIPLLLIPASIFGQYHNGWETQFFFGRQPSARAEAMGKAYVSIDGDLATTYFNPAGIINNKGLEINCSYASPYYLQHKSYFLYTGFSFRINNYIQCALTRFSWNWPYFESDRNPNTSNSTLTIASEPLANLLLGLNVNYFSWYVGIDDPLKTIYLDFGAIKKFQFLQKKTIQHSTNLAASISNFNSTKVSGQINVTEVTNELPVQTRLGANYNVTLDKHILFDNLKSLEFLIQYEYQMLLNSDYYRQNKIGGELKILETLAIRVGYYNQKIPQNEYSDVNYNKITDFTYGLGVHIPLDKLTSIPVDISFDYTSLPQTAYSSLKTESELGNFSTFSLRINYSFIKLKTGHNKRHKP